MFAFCAPEPAGQVAMNYACENLGEGFRKSSGGQGTTCHLKLAAAGPEKDAEGGHRAL